MSNDARFIRPDRVQTRWDLLDLEGMLPRDHRARIVMSFVEQLDLSALYDAINAREGEPGRPPPERVSFARYPYLFPQPVYNSGRSSAVARPTPFHAQRTLSTSERNCPVPTLSTPIHSRSQAFIPSGGQLSDANPTDVDKPWGNRCGQTLSVTSLSTGCGNVWISC